MTQRGNRREQVFFEDGDYELYLDLLSDAATRSGVAIWSYCLMPNHELRWNYGDSLLNAPIWRQLTAAS